MMTKKNVLYADLVEMSSPEKVFAEVLRTIKLVDASLDTNALKRVFRHVCDLYKGHFPGYRSCNTHYHDLRHVTDVLLALARLIHGAYEDGINISRQEMTLALISALLHDTGYIQKDVDHEGTGGKYTLTHVTRSVEFMEEYFDLHGYTKADSAFCRDLIIGTSLSVDFGQIAFSSPSAALLGKFVATADFLGQIADRVYLEKLLFLYREFKEANVLGYDNELELLAKTIGFYDFMQARLVNTLSDVQKFMQPHFRSRWMIDRDFYQEAVCHNIEYLNSLLKKHDKNYRGSLKREGIVARLEELEKAEAKQNSEQTPSWPVVFNECSG